MGLWIFHGNFRESASEWQGQICSQECKTPHAEDQIHLQWPISRSARLLKYPYPRIRKQPRLTIAKSLTASHEPQSAKAMIGMTSAYLEWGWKAQAGDYNRHVFDLLALNEGDVARMHPYKKDDNVCE